MPDGRAIHGKNAYIYIGGVAIDETLNSWDITINTDVVETDGFGKSWKNNVPGLSTASGNFAGWQHQDKRVLIDAVTGRTALATYIYPDKSDTANYISFSAVYTQHSGSASTSAAVAGNAAFVVDGTLTVTGFA